MSLHHKFWSSARRKIAVAKKQAASGKFVDGELAMQGILDELADMSSRKLLRNTGAAQRDHKRAARRIEKSQD